ncbi:HlyIII-domain-containing protein [Annulohypoxylon maeteangense]|uniref:HlyIII-domain-containing protein n=1 Tax=Annulohypoxylon maeteangense TaxID=1927788 RepID=UPI00200843D4|nr:HlyIII-domain-containing protein [Annulohypoxylon maeteangense]KAI0889842.1 HlyIII-domain-containing protein [Annulohypoxylon maeteangense]
MTETTSHTASGLRKRRSSSSASKLAHAAADVEHKLASALLILWDDLPSWRRDNHFIETGYRRDSNSYWRSFTSLFYVHNESVNIWTHLLGALFVPAAAAWLYHVIAPRYASANASDVLVFGCFFAGAVMCLDAISNHSEEVAKWGNKLDYSGIIFLIVGSYVPALYYALFCLPNLMTVYLYGVLAAAWYPGLNGFGHHAGDPIERLCSLAWEYLESFLSTTAYLFMVINRLMSVWDLIGFCSKGSCTSLGRFFMHFPRTFDIWGSSHQLFHILILFAAASHLTGMIKAFDYHHSIMAGQC